MFCEKAFFVDKKSYSDTCHNKSKATKGSHSALEFYHKRGFPVARIYLTFRALPCYNFLEACRQHASSAHHCAPSLQRRQKQGKVAIMKEKLTKRKLIVILSSVTGSILLLIAILAACSTLALPNSSEGESESGTVQLPTHLDQSETNSEEQLISSDNASEQESSSQNQESNSANNTTSGTESSEESTEEPTINEPEYSLEFTSNGNGTCSVSGIGSIIDSYIVIPLKSPEGDVVTSISERAFYGNNIIRAVEIPSTVYYIGDMAFSNCSQLVYISVDKENRSFTDLGGILFSADMTCLMAYPAANGASAISLPTSITKIAPMAFYNCTNLKTIDYEGSAEQWSNISIGQMNYGLYSASIICKK